MVEELKSRRFVICVVILLINIVVLVQAILVKKIDLDGYAQALIALNICLPVFMLASTIEKYAGMKFGFKKGDIEANIDLGEKK
jgi:hypothetical protein